MKNRPTQPTKNKHALLIVGGVLAAFLISGCGAGSQPSASATSTVTTSHQAAKPTPKPTATSKPYTGPAVLGAPLSAFIKQYGPNRGTNPPPYTFPTDANDDADVIVTVAHGTVNSLVLAAFNATWDIQQTFTECVPFLPVGATQYPGPHPLPATGGAFIDYHSTLGEVIMNVAPGSCELTIG